MTRDEIMQMSADELRIAIAKAKGMDCGLNPYDIDYCLLDTPNWSISIADAWQLWDELPHPRELFDVPDGEIACHAGGEQGFMGHYHGWRASGADAPLAISRAYLIWKLGGE